MALGAGPKPKCPTSVDGVLLTKKKDFVDFLDQNCPHFELVQGLTNGSKHAFPVHSGGEVEGYGNGPFGIGPFGAPYLLIDLGAGAGTGMDRYLVASSVIEGAARYMIDLSKRLGA